MANPDFRQMFADHVYKDLSTVLSPTTAAAMYQTWPIRSARPSSTSRPAGATSASWTAPGIKWARPPPGTTQLDLELGSLFPTRTATMFTQFETAVTFSPPPEGGSETYTMYPSFAPPMLYVNGTVENGGTFTPGDLAHDDDVAPAGDHLLHDRRQRSAGRQHRFHGLQHHAQRHDGHGHAGRREHRASPTARRSTSAGPPKPSTTASSRSPT